MVVSTVNTLDAVLLATDRLSYREDLGGSLGEPELEDPEDALHVKVQQLRHLVQLSCYIADAVITRVVITRVYCTPAVTHSVQIRMQRVLLLPSKSIVYLKILFPSRGG